ncbi:hypothetical protein [Natronoarchaeum rubrum]|uniref:hypothetical protein n=1 Tax=Natronoarchaeum rubrum TaxID=755311 RepID=UPI0021121FE6|nr:hypothetical protein [Natronoarchaeum rubrum]
MEKEKWTVESERMAYPSHCEIVESRSGYECIIESQPVDPRSEQDWFGVVQEYEGALGVTPCSEGYRVVFSTDNKMEAKEIATELAKELDAFAYPSLL